MALKMVSLECPNCHAQLQIEEGREYAYCSYCGAKFLIEDDSTHTTIIISRDESEIARTNAEKEIRLKEIESEERSAGNENKRKILKIILPWLAILLICVVPFLIWLSSEGVKIIRGDIHMTYSSKEMIGQSTDTVAKRLKKLGFTDIEMQVDKPGSLKERLSLFKYRSGEVTSVSVNGSHISNGEYYPKDSTIVIQYKK